MATFGCLGGVVTKTAILQNISLLTDYLKFYNYKFILEDFLVVFLKIKIFLSITLYLNQRGISDWLLSMRSTELWEGKERLKRQAER